MSIPVPVSAWQALVLAAPQLEELILRRPAGIPDHVAQLTALRSLAITLSPDYSETRLLPCLSGLQQLRSLEVDVPLTGDPELDEHVLSGVEVLAALPQLRDVSFEAVSFDSLDGLQVRRAVVCCCCCSAVLVACPPACRCCQAGCLQLHCNVLPAASIVCPSCRCPARFAAALTGPQPGDGPAYGELPPLQRGC